MPERVLVVLVAGIGDFVLATPAIRAIRRGFPDAQITLLTTPQAAELARPCPHFHDVVTFDLRTYRPAERGWGWSAWRRLQEMKAELRPRRFSLAINLYAVATWAGAVRMALLFSRIRARRTAGRWSRGRGLIFDVRSSDMLHEMEAMLTLAHTLGCVADDKGPTLWIPESSRQTAAQCLKSVGIASPSPYVVMHVGSNKPEARLPEDRAVDIGREIGRAMGAPVVLIGDQGDAALMDRLSARLGGDSQSLAGRTDLLELAAILAGAQAAVTTDSGPMHLAAAMGVPLVALFGPSDPGRFGPRGQTGRVAVLQGTGVPHYPTRWHADIRTEDVVDALLNCVHTARASTPE